MTVTETDAVGVARAVLTDLERALAGKDHAEIVGVYTDDAVLIADDAEYFTQAAIEDYLQECADMAPIITWTWDQIAATAYSPTVVGFGAVATMIFVDGAGERLAPPEPFRMSCVVTEQDGRWRISQYHGSRPVT